MAMNAAEEESKKKSEPKLVKLDRSFKLAEQWVNNMSGSSVNDKSAAVELEGRPARLGIGATVPRESKLMLSNDPVERKLLAKLNANKRKVIERVDPWPSARNRDVDEESEEDESESKTKVFGKKRPVSNVNCYGKKEACAGVVDNLCGSKLATASETSGSLIYWPTNKNTRPLFKNFPETSLTRKKKI